MIHMVVYTTAIFANRRHNFFILNANESCFHSVLRIITFYIIAIKEKSVLVALFTEFQLNIVGPEFGYLNLKDNKSRYYNDSAIRNGK